jgi:hypothetical protein
MKPTRREFIRYAAATGIAVVVPRRRVFAAAAGSSLRKYVQPLPKPGAGIVVATPISPYMYSFTQTEIARQIHRDLPATPLWA